MHLDICKAKLISIYCLGIVDLFVCMTLPVLCWSIFSLFLAYSGPYLIYRVPLGRLCAFSLNQDSRSKVKVLTNLRKKPGFDHVLSS